MCSTPTCWRSSSPDQVGLAAASSRLEARLRYGRQRCARSATSAGSGRWSRRLDDPHPGRGEYGVERHGELGVPIPDQELHAVSVFPEVHQQVAARWATHSPVGCAVTPARCTRRVPCSMKNSTYRRRKNTVSTWKKSVARIVFAWASRNVRQVSRHEPRRSCPATARLVPLAIGAAARGPERECHR